MTSPDVPLMFERLSETEQLRRARSFYELMSRRRSVRHFAPDPVPRALLEDLLRTAGTAPSGAHRQPWRFVAVDDQLIRLADAIQSDSYVVQNHHRIFRPWIVRCGNHQIAQTRRGFAHRGRNAPRGCDGRRDRCAGKGL